MTTTVSTYPWHQFLDSTATWHKGNGLSFGVQKTFTFPDILTNVSSVDFTGMRKSNGGLVTFKNTTKQVNGGFSIYVYDEGNNVIGQSVISINKNQTKYSSNFSEIILPSGSNVKKIIFFAYKNGAHVSVAHDSTSEFTVTHVRNSSISFTPYSTAADWISTDIGSSFRIVNRISYAYRKIANDDDEVLLTNLQNGSLVHGLVPGETYTLVLQQLGVQWYDVAQDVVTTNETEMTIIDKGSGYITAQWQQDFPGALYKLIATPESGTSVYVETTELSGTVRGLLPGTSYTLSITSSI